ncbi:MAG: carboxylating nicotinate-nucleotide diphosphorylase [bacterium]|nr:carboxylating nicotinate-nucleotide diphosphorylase [bacterium]
MKSSLENLIKSALAEDLPSGDVTTELMAIEDTDIQAGLISREDGIFFGQEVILSFFNIINQDIKIQMKKSDGDPVTPGEEVCILEGSFKTLLKSERVMLNFLQRLSGVATITGKFVKRLNNNKIKILDTRKTTPLFRKLEKQAILAGGGFNHRQGLSDMVLIKENHITAFKKKRNIEELPAVLSEYKKKNPDINIEIEIEEPDQLYDFDFSIADYIMFDNFEIADIKKGIEICRDKQYKAEIEVSGNISLENIHFYSNLDIDRISIGSLTHSVKALDMSLLFY